LEILGLFRKSDGWTRDQGNRFKVNQVENEVMKKTLQGVGLFPSRIRV
jgi:hypothetical protein